MAGVSACNAIARMSCVWWAMLYLILGCAAADETLGRKANANWVCRGCRGAVHEMDIYGQIHNAIHREERKAYLALDFSWIDKMLLPDAQVEVVVVPEGSLASYIHPTTPLDERALSTPTSEEEREKQIYHIVVSEVPENVQAERHHLHRTARRASYLDPPHPSALIFGGVDEMLVHNPCFFPLAEPIRATHGKIGSMAAIGNRRRRLSGEHVLNHGAINNRLLVLIGFPRSPMHATCVLYKSITKDQFPQRCDYTHEKMSVNELSNIGWAHTVIHLVHSFFDKSMIHNKVVIMPKADAYYSRPMKMVDPKTNQTVVSHSGWGWADPSTCPPDTYLHDPWACNFLSISNCSNRHLSEHIKPESLTSWSTPSVRMQGEVAAAAAPVDHGRNRYEGGLRITDAIRNAYGDGSKLSEESWAQSRLYAFLQRPNAYLRLLIRVSLRNIATAMPSSMHPAAHPKAPQMGSDLSSLLTPCLAMHIRHQDLFLEGHRVIFGIDRSFESHVRHALNMTRSLGLKKIYLATDNSTIFDVAASIFPEYSWIYQKRPVPR